MHLFVAEIQNGLRRDSFRRDQGAQLRFQVSRVPVGGGHGLLEQARILGRAMVCGQNDEVLARTYQGI